MKLTPVFPHDVLPVRSGVYMTQNVSLDDWLPENDWNFSHYDATDRIWGCGHKTVKDAAKHPDYEFAWSTKQWRGIEQE